MTKSNIARKWRGEYPDMPTMKLARMMYAKNKLEFKDVEDARGRLRYIEGKNGKNLRKYILGTEFFKEEARPLNPYNLPESDEMDYEPYVFKGHK